MFEDLSEKLEGAFRRLRSRGILDEAAIADVVGWVTAGPAIAQALDLARHYGARARALLSEFPASPERAVLDELVGFVLARSR